MGYDVLEGKSYTEVLRQRADNLTQLLCQLNDQRTRLAAIENDWQAVQRNEVDRLSRSRNDVEERMRNSRDRMSRLEVSEKATVIATKEIKKSYPTSGWWALCMFGGGWGWGKQPATQDLSYNDAWFSEYKVRGGDYTATIKNHKPADGILEMGFTSTPGTDLNIEVDFIRPEKDTEETKRLVGSLGRQVEELQEQLVDLDRKIAVFRSIGSAVALVNLFMEEKVRLEKIDKDFAELLGQTAFQPSDEYEKPPSEFSVLTNTFKLLSVLVEKKRLPTDLAACTCAPINGFLAEFKRWQKLQTDVFEIGKTFVSLKRTETPLVHAEDVAPVQPSLSVRAHACLESLPYDSARGLAASVLDATSRNPIALAGAVGTYGVLLKLTPAQSMQAGLGHILISVTVFPLLSALLNRGTHMAAMAADSVDRRVDGTTRLADGGLQGLSGMVRELLEKGIDRFSKALENSKLVRVF